MTDLKWVFVGLVYVAICVYCLGVIIQFMILIFG